MATVYFVQIKTDNSWWAIRDAFKTEARAASCLRRMVGLAKRENTGKKYRILEKDITP